VLKTILPRLFDQNSPRVGFSHFWSGLSLSPGYRRGFSVVRLVLRGDFTNSGQSFLLNIRSGTFFSPFPVFVSCPGGSGSLIDVPLRRGVIN